jgi:hypothetical protein
VKGPAPRTKLPSGLAAIDSSLLDLTSVLTIRWPEGSIQLVTSELAVPRMPELRLIPMSTFADQALRRAE